MCEEVRNMFWGALLYPFLQYVNKCILVLFAFSVCTIMADRICVYKTHLDNIFSEEGSFHYYEVALPENARMASGYRTGKQR